MSNRGLPKDRVHERAVKHSRRLSLGRLSAYVGACLGALVLAVAVLILGFGGAILNGYGKRKAERAFAQAHPGQALRIGKLDYAVGANRLVAQSVTLSATNTSLKAGGISLTGVRWARLLWGTAALADVLAKASLEATNLDVEFPQAHYGLRCARLRASVPGSELIGEGTELRPLVGDEEFFAAHEFRTTRFHVVVPECRVLGLAYGELLQGKSYRARSVHFSRPTFDALVNRDKPAEPFVQRPLMVHEALAAIRQPLQVDSLSITNGHLRYCERVAVGADPAVLTFGAVSLSAAGIANRGGAAAAIQLRAQGDLMNAGTMKVLMTIPVTSRDFSLHYSGSLSAMDLTRLDAFLDIAEHTRIKSGSAQEAAFEIDVTAGQARGRVRAIYRDLEIAVLGKQTGSEKGLGNRVTSFLANVFKIRNANAPDASGSMKEGEVNYTRGPDEEFLQFAWFALRSGVLDVISH
ncbi:MAG: hypothetical protein ABSF95_11270 [Verrucomicrobiota bacterium]|jgi:hypothetical protein